MTNYTFTAFTRNDHAPATAMLGSIAGSLFNIVFDYVFMFPMGLGMNGAALATAVCPAVTMSVCCMHLFGKNNHVEFDSTGLLPGICFPAASLEYRLLWGDFFCCNHNCV